MKKALPDDIRIRRENIVERIRHKILDGTYRPGDQLPTRVWYEKHFHSTTVTVQRAFQVLLDEGVLRTAGRCGTFVSDRPPHLSSYALLLYGRPEKPNLFCSTLQRAASFVAHNRKIRIDCRFLLEMDSGDDRAELDELEYRVVRHLYAGLIFSSNPFRLKYTPVVTMPGMPRVALMSEKLYPGVVTTTPREGELLQRGLEYLRNLGARNIAALVPDGTQRYRAAMAVFSEFGLTAHPEHLHFIPSVSATLSESLTRLLWAPDRSNPPDAIFCGDDNMLPGVLRGLTAALGDRARSIPVVSHANFPLNGKPALPVHYIGYDLVRFIRDAVEVIDAERTGHPVDYDEFRIVVLEEDRG